MYVLLRLFMYVCMFEFIFDYVMMGIYVGALTLLYVCMYGLLRI